MQALLEKHFWTVHLGVLGLSALLAGLAVTDLIEAALINASPVRAGGAKRRVVGASKKRKAAKLVLRSSYFDIDRRNVFCSTCEPKKPEPPKPIKKEEPTAEMKGAELLATLVVEGDDEWSLATVRLAEPAEVRTVRKGSKLRDAEVTKVETRRVTYTRGGVVGYLDLIPSSGAAKKTTAAPTPKRPPHRATRRTPPRRGGTPWSRTIAKGIKRISKDKYEIDRSVVNTFLSNAAMAGRDAAIMPHMVGGKPAGFRLGRVRPGGIFQRLGFRNGDVIQAINGHSISTVDKILSLYTKLPSATHMTVSLRRYGKQTSMDYSIK